MSFLSISRLQGAVLIPSLVILLAWSAGDAVEIRSYSAARHDRFTGFPDAPAWNDSAYYGSRKYSGVGWIPGESPARQFALVSPRHAVFASHYLPGAGTTIRFLGTTGVTVDRTVTGSAPLVNGAGQNTDLSLVTLSSPIPAADQVTHFPYLNLATDSAYVGRELVIFGWHVKAGRGTIRAIEDFTEEGVSSTRAMRFRYRIATGTQDDAYVVVGDSGSPSFSLAGDVPAIVGTHTAAGSDDNYHVGLDSFVPYYISGLDTMMAADGYRMTPAYPPAVTLAGSVTASATLRQALAGSCRFDLANTGANAAGNTRLTMTFQAGQGPDSLTADGWILETQGPDVWSMRRANLAAGATSMVTANWARLPVVNTLVVALGRVADGSAQAVDTLQVPLLPSFAGWAGGLGDETPAGDTDEDGVPNLLEYAFGGDPRVGSRSSLGGKLLIPRLSMTGGRVTLEFPVRQDASARALNYVLEFSDSLAAASWTDSPPASLLDSTAASGGVDAGFLLRTASWEAGLERIFCRVRVVLGE